MNKIYFFIRQLQSIIKNNKLIYSVFFITVSVTICSLVYLYGMSHAHIKSQIDLDSSYRTIVIDLSETPSEDNVKQIFQNKDIPVENIYIQGTLENNEILCGEINPYYYYNYGSGFSTENIENAEKVIMASSAFLLNYKEDYIIINDVEYKLVGELVEPTDTVFKVPYTTLLDNFHVDKFMIILNKTFSAEQLSNLQNLIDQNNIKYNSIKFPNYDSEIQSRQQSQLIFVSFIYIISLINFAYMFYYILTKRKKEFFIYRIIGLSKRAAMINLLCEVACLFILSFICGVLLCKYLLNNILYAVWEIQPINILFTDVLALFVIMLLITIIIMSLIIFKFLSNKIILGLKESEYE